MPAPIRVEAFPCTECKAHGHTYVTSSRPTQGGYAIRRRRRCASCGARFTTYEVRASQEAYAAHAELERQLQQQQENPIPSGPPGPDRG